MKKAQLWIILTSAALLASCGSGSNLSHRDVEEILNVVKLSECEIIHDNGSITFKRSETCDKARLTGAQSFYRFGQSDFHKGKYEEAILNYSKAIYLEPNVADDIYLKRGSIYQILGRYEEAIADYLAYIEIKPEDVRTYQFLALSYIELGRNEEAIAAYDKAIALEPDKGLYWRNRIKAKRALGGRDGAIRDCDHAKSLYLAPINCY